MWRLRGIASLALAAIREDAASMATLEKRSGSYRAIFYFGGQLFARSLMTDNPREALASMARLASAKVWPQASGRRRQR